MMNAFTRRRSLGCLAIVLIIAAVLAGCENKERGEALVETPPSLVLFSSVQPTAAPTGELPAVLSLQLIAPPISQPTATPFSLGPLFDSDIDLMAGPIEVPLELQIPSLKVNAPVLGVGLTVENEMDAPKGSIGDPVWHSAFWYRGSGIPGESGTTTIAGHVNDPLGRPEIFADLQDLNPGDPIIVRHTMSNIDIRFVVEQVKVYSIQESSDPAVFAKIFGAGPVAGTGPQPAADGLSHLTLITCAGNIVNGQFDHHTVVFATQSE